MPSHAPSGDQPSELDFLLSEIEKLRSFVHEVYKDFGTIHPSSIRDLHIPRARDHLGEVVRSTGHAATEIIDACELIQAEAAAIGGDAAARIDAAVMAIYQACSFHDLTGQRIGKVNSTLEYIDDELRRILRRLSGGLAPDEAALAATTPTGRQSDIDLLEGPQPSGRALDQDAIDQLLADQPRSHHAVPIQSK